MYIHIHIHTYIYIYIPRRARGQRAPSSLQASSSLEKTKSASWSCPACAALASSALMSRAVTDAPLPPSFFLRLPPLCGSPAELSSSFSSPSSSASCPPVRLPARSLLRLSRRASFHLRVRVRVCLCVRARACAFVRACAHVLLLCVCTCTCM